MPLEAFRGVTAINSIKYILSPLSHKRPQPFLSQDYQFSRQLKGSYRNKDDNTHKLQSSETVGQTNKQTNLSVRTEQLVYKCIKVETKL